MYVSIDNDAVCASDLGEVLTREIYRVEQASGQGTQGEKGEKGDIGARGIQGESGTVTGTAEIMKLINENQEKAYAGIASVAALPETTPSAGMTKKYRSH